MLFKKLYAHFLCCTLKNYLSLGVIRSNTTREIKLLNGMIVALDKKQNYVALFIDLSLSLILWIMPC